jgi:cation transport ATPase
VNGAAEGEGRLRRAVTGLLAMALVGTGAELLLLEHYEDAWQFVPLVLIALGLLAMGWRAVRPGRASLRAFRVVMVLMVASGALGLFLHYRGNTEFELERDPGLAGFALFREAMTGATPALAPGAMMLFGLLGLVSAARSAMPAGTE